MRTLLTLVLPICFAQEAPLEHWSFDGDPAPARSLGRVQQGDSPIGAGGKMLVLNGVDAFVQSDPPGLLGAGKGAFSVSLWICPLELREAVIISRGDDASGWSIHLAKDGSLSARFATGESFKTGPRNVAPHEWTHVVLRRSRTGDLHLNGRRAVQADLKEGDLDPPKAPCRIGRGSEDARYFCGLIDEVKLYSRLLSPEEIAGLAREGLPWVLPRPHAATPFGASFVLEKDDVVAFAGGEDVVAAQDSALLEALLSTGTRGKRVLFRSLAWEGDTVYEQPRPLNFGPWGAQLSRVGASVIVTQFGQTESLEGKGGLARFTAAYEKLLADFTGVTRRIVVVSPFPFEKPAPPLPDLSAKNGDLRLYVEAMKSLAMQRRLLFVDLFSARLEAPLTRDGLHLSAAGQEAVAREIARQLGIPLKEDLEPLRARIRRKNRLWLDVWRPSNWAFLNGDRIEQPSSRDHVDKRVRWFPVELQETLALLRREEAAIEKLVEAKR